MIERALLKRIITALVLAPLAVAGILLLPVWGFALVVAIIVAMGAWEWARIAGLVDAASRAGFTLLVFALMFALFPQLLTGPGLPFALLEGALIWWVLALIAVVRFPQGSKVWRSGPLLPLLAGLLILVPTWLGLVALRHYFGPGWVLLLMLLVWGADTGAYFAGRRFGRRKLAPQVSPGKTVEGVGGALAVTVALAIAGGYRFNFSGAALLLFVGLCVATLLISVLGDLVESMFKRISGIKDSGSLLPGHGGVLDRIDSVSAAAPLFVTGLWLIRTSA